VSVGQMKKCRKCYEAGSEVIHLPRPKNRSNVPRPSKREYLDIANRNMSKIDKQKTHQNMGETSSPLPSLPARKPPKKMLESIMPNSKEKEAKKTRVTTSSNQHHILHAVNVRSLQHDRTLCCH
jgi:hypothetical protein